MVSVGDLSARQLRARLAGDGLFLRTGGFTFCVRSTVGHVADAIGLLYPDYPLAGSDFADFRISLNASGGLRRWWHRQVRFDYDGMAPFKPLPIDQAFPMFEWIQNWCVSSRANGYLIIHAAVVERGGRAAILPAPPGSGKSTLCAALVSRGWRLLSDELALIDPASGQLVPLPRPVSLKNASIDIMRAYAPEAVFSRVVSDTVKGSIAHMRAPPDSVRRAGETARPAWIVFPKYAAGAAASMTPLAPARAFMSVAENGFNYSQLAGTGFDALAAVLDQCAAYQFSYSALDDGIAAFERLAEMP